MRDLTAFLLCITIYAIVQGWMWYLLYTRVSEIAEHQVRIIGLLQTRIANRAKLTIRLTDDTH